VKVRKTPFEGLLLLEPKVFEDARGYFYESFNQNSFWEIGIDTEFVQDNQSYSRKGVLRGLHFQKPPFAQTKLVRVLSGRIQDVVVDLRKEQSTFKKYFSIELFSENKQQLLVPKGFAHGFLVLSEFAEVLYKCDEYYHPETEAGIIYNDPEFGIDWKLNKSAIVVSKKDQQNPTFTKTEF